jgi:WD40 repeat protein
MSAKTPKQKTRAKLLKGHEVNIYESQSIRELCKLSDGFLASRGNGDRNIRIWDITTGKCIQIIDTGITVNNTDNMKTMAHISSETSPNLIAFLRDVANPIYSSSNIEIGICNYITGEIIDQNPAATIRDHILPVAFGMIYIQEICGFNANIAFLVRSQFNRYYICIWNTDIGDYVNTIQLEGIPQPRSLCAVGPNLLAFTDAFRIYILNWENGVLRHIDTTFTRALYHLEYIGNGKILVADRGATVEIINIDTSDLLHSLDRNLFVGFGSICHLMNNYVALYTVDKIKVWNVDTNKMVNTLTVDIKAPNSPALTYLGDNRIAIAGYIKKGKKQEPVIQIIDTDNKYLDANTAGNVYLNDIASDFNIYMVFCYFIFIVIYAFG